MIDPDCKMETRSRAAKRKSIKLEEETKEACKIIPSVVTKKEGTNSFLDDWRLPVQFFDIASLQNEARKRSILTDIQFVIKTEKSRLVFNAHKLVLAFGSPVFEKMFYGPLAEKKNVIEMDDDAEAFQMLMSYLYGKPEKLLSEIYAWKCYVIADKYLVVGFKQFVDNYMSYTNLSKETFWWLIENNLYSDPFFQRKFNKFMEEDAKEIFKSENFYTLKKDFLNNILQMDSINATEYEILLNVTKWVYKTVLPEEQPEGLLAFYKHIRFSTLTSTEYCEFIDKFPGAIETQSNLKILKHIINKSYSLPEWCSTNLVKRNKKFDIQITRSSPSSYQYDDDDYYNSSDDDF